MGSFCSSDTDVEEWRAAELESPLLDARKQQQALADIPSLLDICLHDMCDHLAAMNTKDVALLARPQRAPPVLTLGSRRRPRSVSDVDIRAAPPVSSSKNFSFVEQLATQNRLPDDLMERAFTMLVRQQRLHHHNLGVFSSCNFVSLRLARYPFLCDEWVRLLVRHPGLHPLPLPAQQARRKLSPIPVVAHLSPAPTTASASLSTPIARGAASNGTPSLSFTIAGPASGTPPSGHTPASVPAMQRRRSTGTMDLLSSLAMSPARLFPHGLGTLRSAARLRHFDVSFCIDLTDRTLQCLEMCTRVATFKIRGCAYVTDKGFSVVRDMMELEEVDCGRCQALTDASVSLLFDKKALRVLDMDSCVNVTDEGISCLRELPGLRVLRLGHCLRVSLVGLAQWNMDALQEVSLARTAVSDQDFGAFVKRTPHLTSLDLSGTALTDVGLKALCGSPPPLRLLESLDLSRTGVVNLRFLPFLPSLHSLNLNFTGVAPSQLKARLPACALLKVLELESCSVTDGVMAAVGKLVQLEELNVADTPIGNRGFGRLAALAQLQKLNCSSTDVTDGGLEVVRRLHGLRDLSIDSAELTDSALRHVRDLEHLERLDLFGSNITDAGLQYLVELPNLTTLEVCSGRLTNEGLALLCRIPTLTHLNLSQNRGIDDRGLASLANLTRLRHLNLSSTSVTHRGLAFVKAIPRIRSLSLYGCHRVNQTSSRVAALAARVNIGLESRRMPSIPLFEEKTPETP